MVPLSWDAPGSRYYEAGLDRGVLYPPGASGVVWNGLTSVDISTNDSSSPVYESGIKFLDKELLGDTSGKLRAFTYPEEFEVLSGYSEPSPGIFFAEQPKRMFSLSYRTKIGNDTDNEGFGYKIHILYNILVIPDSTNYESLGLNDSAIEFRWDMECTPESIVGYRPTAYIILDSTLMDPLVLQAVEDILYGTETNNPSLPPLQDLIDLLVSWYTITIVDNGDGTWTATSTGPHADDNIVMVDATTFQINNIDADYIDPETYTISTTFLG